jgi:hypothetical protein
MKSVRGQGSGVRGQGSGVAWLPVTFIGSVLGSVAGPGGVADVPGWEDLQDCSSLRVAGLFDPVWVGFDPFVVPAAEYGECVDVGGVPSFQPPLRWWISDRWAGIWQPCMQQHRHPRQQR